MTISADDVKFRKSVTVTDTGVNGGRKGTVEKLTGTRHALFPRVTKTERLNGVTRYRKEFLCNENAADEPAYDLLVWIDYPSIAGDRFYIASGTQVDTQVEIVATPPLWMGCGQLSANISSGATTVSMNMESNDFQFEPGGVLHLANKLLTGQTVDSGANPGDSVEYIGSTWFKTEPTGNIEHPKGIYVGSGNVISNHGSMHEEFLTLAENHTVDESIGTGDGTTLNPALSNLASVTNGLLTQEAYKPSVRVLCGGVEREVFIEADGSCSGYCTAGQINVDTGVWSTPISWSSAPDNGESIKISYYDKNFSYSGNTVTVHLDGQVANNYTAANSFAAGCLRSSVVQPTFEDWAISSTNGTYDKTQYPPVLTNLGTERDVITITMTSATTFSCSGTVLGDLGTGDISSDFSPINSRTGKPYFTLKSDGWGGTWAANDTIQFIINPAAFPIWWKEVVPAATVAEADNTVILSWYCE